MAVNQKLQRGYMIEIFRTVFNGIGKLAIEGKN